MDFAAVGDWDWTDNPIDGEDQADESSRGFAYSQQTGVIFLVDCNPLMFVKHEEDESNFDKCLKCIRSVYQKKVLSNEKDMLSVMFYGLAKSSADDGKAIYILQDLDQLNIKRITDLEEILNDSAKYAAATGHSDNYEMSDVLWACSNVFAKCNKTFGEKKVLLFTNNDDPCNGNVNLMRKTRAKATDLKSMGIELELLALKGDGDSVFQMEKFYKELLQADLEVDDGGLPEATTQFEELLSRVYRKQHRRRALGRIPFQLSDSVQLSVGVYCLCRRTTNPSSVKIHRDTNSEVRTQTRVYNAATGDDVMPQDIMFYQEYAGKRICLTADEVADMKKFDISGLRLKGFKKRCEVKLHLQVKPSHFIYPDETSVKGSSTLFSALLSRCAARDMVAVCWYVPRSNSTIELVYLLPQQEQRDSHNNQLTPPGFHVVFCAYKEDMRELALPEKITSVDDDQVAHCKAMIKKLSFTYEPSLFENPSLTKFYSNLEAMALNRDEPDEVQDYTIPNLAKMNKKAGTEIDEFKSSVFPDGYTGPTTAAAKRPAAGASGAAKKSKLDPTSMDIGQLARSDGLNKLTVADLKVIIRDNRIHTSATKKADIILAIKHHFGA